MAAKSVKITGAGKTDAATEDLTPKAKPVKFVIPKAIGACADMLLQLKADKASAQKKVDDIAEQITALQNHLIANLPKSEATGAVGKIAKALIKVVQEPVVENWELFYAHIAKTKSWDLMQRRLSPPAVKERWEARKQVPGVGTQAIVKVSVTKI